MRLATAAFALALLACSRRDVDVRPEPRGSASGTEGAASLPPEYELLDPGAEPRRALRFEPVAGAASTLQVTLRGGEMRPAMRLSVEARAAEVTPGGSTRTELRVATATTPEGEDLGIWGLVGLDGAVASTSRGGVTKREWKNHGSKAGYVLHNELDQWITDLPPLLPSEPIGVGARWQVTRRVWKRTYEARAALTYRLAEREGPRAVLEVSVTERADPQWLQLTSAALHEEGKLLEMKGEGSARLEVDLAGPPLALGHSVIEDHERMWWSISGNEKETSGTRRLEIDVRR